MKLKQINITQAITSEQKEKLKEILETDNLHANGKIFIKKLDKDFDSLEEITNCKELIADKTGIYITNILLTVGHQRETNRVSIGK